MPWKGKPFGWGQPVPYLQFLPEPQEASVNVLRQVAKHLAAGEDLGGGSVKIAVNYLEPPSVNLASELMFKAYNSDIKMKRTVKRVPKPDPRKSIAKFKLWKYWFKQANVAVTRPDEKFIGACAKLAVRTYDYELNWKQAAQLVAKATVDQIPSILAVMVHPPLVQDAIEAWVWLQRSQLAAAQMVAHIEINHQIPIEKSALIEITNGPIDWIIDAAAIAITQRARQENNHGEWLCGHFFSVFRRLPNQGYWSTREVLMQNVLLLPGLDDELLAEVRRIIEKINSDS